MLAADGLFAARIGLEVTFEPLSHPKDDQRSTKPNQDGFLPLTLCFIA